MLDSDEVAEQGVRAMLRGKKTLVTGTVNKVVSFLAGVLPRAVGSRLSMRVLGRPRDEPRAPASSSSPPPPSPKIAPDGDPHHHA